MRKDGEDQIDLQGGPRQGRWNRCCWHACSSTIAVTQTTAGLHRQYQGPHRSAAVTLQWHFHLRACFSDLDASHWWRMTATASPAISRL